MVTDGDLCSLFLYFASVHPLDGRNPLVMVLPKQSVLAMLGERVMGLLFLHQHSCRIFFLELLLASAWLE